MADQKFKSKVKLQGGASLPAETAERVPVIDASGNLVSSPVTETELGHISGLTSSAQTQITTAQDDATQSLSDLQAHLDDAVDAHDASSISSISAGNLAATDVQSALDELQGDIDLQGGFINDIGFATTQKVDKSGDTMSGVLDMSSNKITNIGAPSNPDDAATKGYVDTNAIDYAPAVPADWDVQPITVKEGVDNLAERVRDQGGFIGDIGFATTQLELNKLSLIGGTMTGDIAMSNNSITGLDSPIADQDAANKAYVDSVAQGLSPKASVKASSVAPLPAVTAAGSGVGKTLTADANGELSLDGISVFVDIANDGGSANPVDSIGIRASRVLIKDQVNPIDNGIYAVQDKGSVGTPFILVRSIDTDGTPASEVESVFVFVREGTVNADTGWTMITDAPTVDTSALDFVQFSAAGQVIGGNGIDKTGNTLSVDHDGEGLTFSGVQLALELDGATLSKSASGIKLSDTAVTPASYGSASESLSVIVDQQGRLTAASAQSISIASSQVSDFNEAAQDAVGTILGGSSTIDFGYTDEAPSIVASVKFQLSIDADASGIRLVNDVASPGNVQYYGTDGFGTKGFHPVPAVGSVGDIQETSFSAADNQVAATDVTGLVFAAGAVRGFKALVTVEIDATADLFEAFELVGINKGGSFDMAISSVGDDSSITLSITAAGQVQYTSGTAAGFVSNTIKFRAITTSL
jgi:hypothetical protein